MRRVFLLLFTVFVVACSHRSGCDPVDADFDLDLNGGKDECTPAGGTCSSLFCPTNTTPSMLHCGFLSSCCMPGRGSGSSGWGGSSSGSGGPTPQPFDEGTCNGVACKAGCQCLPTGTSSSCTSTCDCSPDAGFEAGAADAGDVDAAEAGDPDGGDPDAGDPDAGEAGTAVVEGPPAPCGLITCSARCRCLSQSLSVCECRSGACDP